MILSQPQPLENIRLNKMKVYPKLLIYQKQISVAVCTFCLICGCTGQKESVQTQHFNAPTVKNIGSYQNLPGQELWYGDPYKPYRDVFVNFNDEDNRGTTPTLTTVDDPEFGKVWKVYKPAGAKRAEISRAKGYDQHEGETIYISYNWKISVKQESFKAGCAVFQWKTEGGGEVRQNYPFTLGYGNGTLSLSMYSPGETSNWWQKKGETITSKKNNLWKKEVPQNTWQNIVFGVRVSSYIGTDTAKLGYLEYWFNGVKQKLTADDSSAGYKAVLSDDKTRAYIRTLDGNITYPKWGAYGESARNYDITAFVGDLRIRRK